MTRHMAQTNGKRCMELTCTSLKKLSRSGSMPLRNSQLTEAQGRNGLSTGSNGLLGMEAIYGLGTGGRYAEDGMRLARLQHTLE